MLVSDGVMYDEATDLLPYRCPSCGSSKRFRSLVALRMHMSVIHSLPSVNKNGGNYDSGKESKLNDANKPKDKWEELLTSGASVDSMLDRYSSKMDTILSKYDREAQELENKVRIAKQLAEIRKQKKELKKMSSSWKAAHNVSQLVKDTDDLIQRSVNGCHEQGARKSKEDSEEVQRTLSGHLRSSNPELERQVQLSIELAAKYKSLALETESKLKEKEIEEKHMKRYIEHIAKKEGIARQQLGEFMEEILERAECAEEELETYKSQSSLKGFDSNRSSLKNRRRSLGNPTNRTSKSSAKQLNRSLPTGSSTPKPRSGSLRSSQHQRDSFVDDVLDPPSSLELPRKSLNINKRSSKRNHCTGVDNEVYHDGSVLHPFSNCQNLTSQFTEDERRLVLFFVFAHLPSHELLRCGTVCHEWRDVSHDTQLWSRIIFEDVALDPRLLYSISSWTTETCLIKLKNVCTIDKHQQSIGSFEEGLESILQSCGENLLVISVENCDPAVTSRTMWLLTCYNKNVRSVTYRSALDPISYQVAWAMGTACRNVQSLEVAPLHPCSAATLFDNNVARLMSWCWPRLQALSIGGAGIDGQGLLAVALNCHHLKVLEMDHAKGVTEETAKTVCKHGLKDLQMLLFTHTPVAATTVVVFLLNSPLTLLKITVTQKDYFPKKGKQTKLLPEYHKLQVSLQKLQTQPEYQRVLEIQC